MPLRIEDYALIGDTFTAGLVGKDGSIDWLCLPRFDSDACCAALLGRPENGRWVIQPAAEVREVRRRYRPGTLVLETEFVCTHGTVRLVDCMPPREANPDVLRIVEGVTGEVPMRLEWMPRFGYGRSRPWIRPTEDGAHAIAGPDALELRSSVPLEVGRDAVRAAFEVRAGQKESFCTEWFRSYLSPAPSIPVERAVEDATAWWQEWSRPCAFPETCRDPALTSLVVLKALTYRPSGGIVAAPTTSLPEKLGGVRNWDYRFCWLRDATFTLYALMLGGFRKEAEAWRDWLLRAIAGDPNDLQILYGLSGERRVLEVELPWLDGYMGSKPVRIGNAAAGQFQLDVVGEVMDCMHLVRRIEAARNDVAWDLQKALMDFLEGAWTRPDEGIWEVRGPRRHFTHSKVMAWVAADRAVKAVERFGRDGPVDRWRALREQIRDEVLTQGFDAHRGTFVQTYGGHDLDASLLLIPLVGFLPATDPRVIGTVTAIERELTVDGLVLRYRTSPDLDGLPPGEGVFLACSFWLADNLALQGRRDEAQALFDRLCSLRNDVGLLAEQYDPVARRQLGNFPQAFTHVALVNTAMNLWGRLGPALDRADART